MLKVNIDIESILNIKLISVMAQYLKGVSSRF